MVQMTPQAAPTGPWDRFGWIMSVIWLVFLGFPIASVLRLHDMAQHVLGFTAIAAFAGVYVYAFVFYARRGTPLRTRTWTLVGLAGLALVLAASIGPEALALSPFIVAYAAYHQPFYRAMWLTLATLLTVVAVLTVTGTWGYLGALAGVVILVALATGASRWIEEKQEGHLELHKELQRVAERERMARDVHDVLGHSLTVITVKSELARRLIEVDPDKAAEEISEVEALARQALAEIRVAVSGDLTPNLTEELNRVERALRSAGIAYHPPTEPGVLADEYDEVAAWVLREAVTNVIRHSGAKTCEVILTNDSLVVTDDGTGLPKEWDNSGNGLRGIRERVHSAGGQLHLSNSPGTRVEVTW